jgi:ABC-type uncharacterized transport system ATPase subunit
LHRGEIAFDGDFAELRRLLTGQRVLTLETTGPAAPALPGAQLVRSEASRHEYVFDSRDVRLSQLLEHAAAQTEVLDVETHRPPIDHVVADLYEHWSRNGAPKVTA